MCKGACSSRKLGLCAPFSFGEEYKMNEEKKTFRLFDSVLMSVVVILVVESAAPAAAIGNSQFFWWIALFLLFFVPYGLISAELGTTYRDNGGMYDWVKRAFGYKMGARVAWYYWINFPLWMASLAVLCSSTIGTILGKEISTPVAILIEIFFVFVVNLIGSMKVSQSKWIINISALFKVFILLSLGAISIYVAITKGAVNSYSLENSLPSFDISSLSFIGVIIFNFLGFEVVTSLSEDMEEPKKQIPKAIILGGILIMIFYLIGSFGISIAIPIEQLSVSSGLLDSFTFLLGSGNEWFIYLIGILFVITLFSNIISWSFGVNYVASYAAKDGSLPRFFSLEDKKKSPIGVSIANTLLAATLVIASHIIPNQDIFWSFFALNMITLLLSYVFVFPAFLKLRKSDKERIRPFKVPGNNVITNLFTFIPVIILVASIIFSAVPLSLDEEELSVKLPILLGTIVALVIGETLAYLSHRKNKSNKLDMKKLEEVTE